MIRILAHFFIKKDWSEEKKRTMLGMLCGITGIFLNICLFFTKLLAGLFSGAVSIMADAFNNLSDAGSSIVTLLGIRLAAQKPDRQHPYGHGRIEYISGFVVSVIILVMGFELMKESIEKILHPATVTFSPVLIVILVISVAVKCYMAFYNSTVGRRISSAPLKATAIDSISDCIATSTVLLLTLLSHYTKINLDGIGGAIVSLFILYAGYSAAKDSLEPLLGNPPDAEFIKHLKSIVLNFDENIVGLHDLMVHDYGPGRRFISLHAEVPQDGNILVLHDIIDNLEKQLAKELNCIATIHMDPVDTKDPKVRELKTTVSDIVKKIHPEVSIHDFRVVWGETHTNLIFDMAVPWEVKDSDEQCAHNARKLIRQTIGEQYYAVINVDRGDSVR